MTNRIDAKFAELRAKGKKAFIPYVTAGDPDADATVEAALALEQAGADLIELGVPYSDPLADGPVIQDAFTRVLARGWRIVDTFAAARRIRERSQVPLLTMASYSLVYRYGPERYVRDAQAAGIDGAIIPDLGTAEGAGLLAEARARDFKTVLLVAPTTECERERAIVRESTGFVYCISVVGITGERAGLPPELAGHVARLKKLTATPVCVGFGVSTPEHVRTVAAIADGVIVGSALVKLMAQNASDRAKMLAEVTRFGRELTGPLR
jgi:tryptophan synthase alpha chain